MSQALKPLPRLPLWRLEMLREQAERRVQRIEDERLAATSELRQLVEAINERRAEVA